MSWLSFFIAWFCPYDELELQADEWVFTAQKIKVKNPIVGTLPSPYSLCVCILEIFCLSIGCICGMCTGLKHKLTRDCVGQRWMVMRWQESSGIRLSKRYVIPIEYASPPDPSWHEPYVIVYTSVGFTPEASVDTHCHSRAGSNASALQ